MTTKKTATKDEAPAPRKAMFVLDRPDDLKHVLAHGKLPTPEESAAMDAKAKRVEALKNQLAAIHIAAEKMTKTVCDSLFVDTIEEAAKVMDIHRNEQHVKELRDERWELEFIKKRYAEIEAELKALE